MSHLASNNDRDTPGEVRFLPKSEPVPAWAALEMSNQARWAGLWAGCADGLARLLRSTTASTEDVEHGLRAYEELRDFYRHPLVVEGGEDQ